MIAHVRLNLFSGRPDPEWTLRDPATRALIAAITTLPVWAAEMPKVKPRLGYSGFTITIVNGDETSRVHVHKGFLEDSRGVRRIDRAQRLEQTLYETAPPAVIKQAGGMSYAQLISTGNEVPIKGLKTGNTSVKCTKGPTLPASKDWVTHTNYNNCYNYANDVLNTDQYSSSALPGTWTDMPPSTPTSQVKTKLRAQIKKDGLTRVVGDKVPANCPATNRHYVAIIVRHHPGSAVVQDFHCLRLDVDGTWSHKDGSKLPRNTDDAGKSANSGDVITDLTAARFDGDPELVGIYRARKNNPKIK